MSNSLNLFLACIIMLIFMTIIIYNLVVPRFTIKEYIRMIICILFIFCALFFINKDISQISFYILPVIFIYLKTHKILKSFFIQALAFTIYLGVACISIKIGMNYMGCSFNDYGRVTIPFELVESSIAVIISFLIGKLIAKYDLENLKFGKVLKSKSLTLIYFIVIISGILLVLCIFDGDSSKFETAEGMLAIFYILIMFIVIGILSYVFIKESDIEKKRIQYENLEEYTEKLEVLYTDMRKFRHDYTNILSSMYSFIEEDDMCGLKKYFNETIQPLNKKMNSNNYKLGLLKNIYLPEVKGIISSKLIKAQELGLDTFIDISEPIDEININIVDLVRSVGIIMDNAIEAALDSEDKKICLGLIKKNQSVIIVVSNSFSGEISPIYMLFKQGFSTKGDNRGLGLSNLKEMLNKYKNVTLDTFIKNEMFFQEITVNNGI